MSSIHSADGRLALISNKNDVSDALFDLAARGSRDDLGRRAVLLRVMTDLFVMKDHHASDEIRQFEEIFLHMVDDVDGETCAVIAGRLANYCATPAAIVHILLARGGKAAAVFLEKSQVVDHGALIHAASFGDTPLAVAVARRKDLDAVLMRTLAARTEPQVLLALAENTSATIPRVIFLSLVRRARSNFLLAHALLARADDADGLAPLFLAATSDVRAAIVLAARRRALGRPPQARMPPDAALLAELEKLAFTPDRRAFTTALAAATGVTTEEMAKVVSDRGGEPLALVLAALGMSPEAATRVFLTGEPAIAHSYERVAALQQLVADISSDTARRLVVRFLDLVPRHLHYVPATDAAAMSTPSRGRFVALFDPPRRTGRSDPRLRRSVDRIRR